MAPVALLISIEFYRLFTDSYRIFYKIYQKYTLVNRKNHLQFTHFYQRGVKILFLQVWLIFSKKNCKTTILSFFKVKSRILSRKTVKKIRIREKGRKKKN